MKLSLIGLLFVSSLVLIKGEESLSPTATCMAELSKYKGCFEKITGISALELFSGGLSSFKVPDTTEDIKNYCNGFYENECANFVKDSSNEKTDCSKDNATDSQLYSLLTSLKIMYLSYCVKDKDDKLCPLSDYLLNHMTELKELSTKENSGESELSKELLTTIANDCKSDICNERLLNLEKLQKSYSDSISVSEGKEGSSVTVDVSSKNDITQKYIQNYKDKKCGSIDGSSDSTSSALTIKGMTYTLVTMIILSILLLI
ncbi:hypothetical protein BCR32DRAFT_326382 [Anaeromyces robustus]|uniref:Uncharacterized protein n=1 Tax=Anaeromyces robustus TaxID=1754192 RepID=A0A1Y1XCQ5_9FUNG|nr:hypothetical protein BCR32DRAFT_326382 [Anaeromyces robustus]|eukprot:ORX83497.1 hypothetical protein BCR32DRAFT_326382 [Anaeromyces robustus]